MNNNTLKMYIRSKGQRVLRLNSKGKVVRDKRKKLVYDRIQGNPRGILLSRVVDGVIQYGWSYQNKKADPVFDLTIGMNVAESRLCASGTKGRIWKNIPHAIMKELPGFINRSRKYFKDVPCELNDLDVEKI